MSSMGAAPPARQPWRGSAAPCHGRLGAWDIRPLALGRQSAGGGARQWEGSRGVIRASITSGLLHWLLRPADPSHHCDALEVRTPDRSDPVKDVTGWPANPNLVRHLKSTLIWTGVHVDEAVMGLSVHTDEDGGGDNPLL